MYSLTSINECNQFSFHLKFKAKTKNKNKKGMRTKIGNGFYIAVTIHRLQIVVVHWLIHCSFDDDNMDDIDVHDEYYNYI